MMACLLNCLPVRVHCGNRSVGGSVDVNTDLIISATAICMSEYRGSLTQKDNTTYNITVMYSGDNRRICVFTVRIITFVFVYACVCVCVCVFEYVCVCFCVCLCVCVCGG